MSPRPLSELLDRTRAALEKYGWCQTVLRDHDGRLCLLGAVRVAICGDVADEGWDRERLAEYEMMERALSGAISGASPIAFNDAPSTTVEDVLSVIESAKRTHA